MKAPLNWFRSWFLSHLRCICPTYLGHACSGAVHHIPALEQICKRLCKGEGFQGCESNKQRHNRCSLFSGKQSYISLRLVCFHRRWGSNHPLGTPQGSFSSACFGLQTRTTPTAKARKTGELDYGHCRFLALWPYDFRNPETLICDDMWLKWFTDQNWDGFRFGIHKTSHKMALIGTQMTICGTYIGTYIGTQMTLLFINVHQYERIPRFQKRYPFWGWRSLAITGITICYGYGWKILDKRQPVDSPPL